MKVGNFNILVRFGIIFTLFAAMNFGSRKLLSHYGSPIRFLVTDKEASFEDILGASEEAWEQIPFKIMIDAADDSFWMHSRVTNGKTKQKWSFINNYSWFRKAEFYVVRGDQVHHEVFPWESRHIFPTVEVELAPGETADFYMNIHGIQRDTCERLY